MMVMTAKVNLKKVRSPLAAVAALILALILLLGGGGVRRDFRTHSLQQRRPGEISDGSRLGRHHIPRRFQSGTHPRGIQRCIRALQRPAKEPGV